jgi:threonine dehydrogenase-like Zn-dependent dehydrogenase
VQAARFYEIKDIRVEEIPIPNTPPGGGLLKVLAAGLCGTDKRIYSSGHFHIQPGVPRILGHEVIAKIVELDRKDSPFKLGDKVTLAPNFGCGVCRECLKGYTQLCKNYDAFGISVDGGFAEYLAIPKIAFDQGNVIPVPQDYSNDLGAMIEISACSFRGMSACSPYKDDTVLIIGGGTVTYLMCGWARTFGVSQVIVSVIGDDWGELSKRGNPNLIINSRKMDLKSTLLDSTDNKGADVVIVACSAKEMDELAPDLAAIQGRVNFFGGLPSTDALVTINSRAIHYREVTITGTTGANADWMHKTLNALKQQPFDIEKGITHHYPLSQIKKAFDESDLTPRLKTIITFE